MRRLGESTYGGHVEFSFYGGVIGNPASLRSRWQVGH